MKDLWRLLKLFRPYAGWIAVGILASLATLIANVTLMAVSGWFIAAMAVAGAAGVTMNYFTPAAVIRACAMLRTGGRYGERLITHEATFRLLSTLRVWFYRRIEPLAPARLQAYRSGDLLSRIGADIDTLDHFYLRILVPSVTALLGALAFVAFLLLYDPRLALILGALLLLSGVLMPWAMQRLGAVPGRRKIERQTALRTLAVESIQGMAELQAWGAAHGHAQELADCSEHLAAEQRRLNGVNGIAQGTLGLAANLALWLTVWTAIPLVRQGQIAPPDLAMLGLFSLAAFEAVLPLPGAFQALGETRAAARRLFDLVDAEPEVPDPVRAAPLPETFDIVLRGVGFTYPGSRTPAIENLDLTLTPGRKLALLGPTGSGKTTLAQLLLRFRAPQQGRITLAGRDIADYGGDDIRRRIALVSQHTHLFTGTLRQNLLLADPQADQARLEQACRAARIHAFIAAQPDGYDTWIGEAGLTLSGGQARRIAVARALLKDAPILILDEPTEGLDAPNAKALMKSVIDLMQQRTVLLITHREDGLEHMDEVLRLRPTAQRFA